MAFGTGTILVHSPNIERKVRLAASKGFVLHCGQHPLRSWVPNILPWLLLKQNVHASTLRTLLKQSITGSACFL